MGRPVITFVVNWRTEGAQDAHAEPGSARGVMNSTTQRVFGAGLALGLLSAIGPLAIEAAT